MTLKSLQLAADWDREKARFPVIAQPKYDGVRGANLFGRVTARSLRPFDNKHVNLFFSQAGFLGLDGEMAAGPQDAEDLCRMTTSALSTMEGQPWLLWHVFDLLTPRTVDKPYSTRYDMLIDSVDMLKVTAPSLGSHLSVMPAVWCFCQKDLDLVVAEHSAAKYEGTIVRDPGLPHKNGRSSPTHGGLLRIKTFMDVDALVIKIIEGQCNQNEAKTNRLGHTERSTHKDNMVPNGMVGAMLAELLEDAVHPFTGELVHRKGEIIRFGAGRMTHDERARYFIMQHLLMGKRIKGQIFPYGVKDKPRFPTFQSLRMKQDAIDK